MRVYGCKCKICGKQLTTDIAYKVKKGSKNFYYCSEEEYKSMAQVIEDRDYCYDIAARVMQVPMITPAMKKEINELAAHYRFIVVARTFKEQRDAITRFLNTGTYTSDYARMRYIMAIIKNNINKVFTQYIQEQKAKENLFKQVQKDSVDIEIMNSLIPQVDAVEIKQNTNVSDISQWL